MLLALLLAAAASSKAETLVVRPDGTGDYTTIWAAVYAADSSDVIELTDGTFTGNGNYNIWIYDKEITIRSQSGSAEACIINPSGGVGEMKRAMSFDGSGPLCVIQDITFTGGAALAGGASDYGGAMKMQSAASPTITGCIFTGNQAGRGGAIFGLNGSEPHIANCIFAENYAVNYGGALCFSSGSQMIEDCTFYGNVSYDYGGAIVCWNGSTLTIDGCTIHGGSAPDGGSAIWCRSDGSPTVTNTIIASGMAGGAVACDDPQAASPTFSCCNIYGNIGGDWAGCIEGMDASDGNISADPLFCDAMGADFTLREDSPCVGGTEPNPECDLIGSQVVGCSSAATHVCCVQLECQLTATSAECIVLGGVYHPEWDTCTPNPCATPIIETSWGSLKALYR